MAKKIVFEEEARKLESDIRGMGLKAKGYKLNIANEENDLIYNHEWIKAYCIAKTKEIWGSILGKYSQSLVGGAQINYGDIKSEAQSEIEKLEQELLDKWSDPVLPQVF